MKCTLSVFATVIIMITCNLFYSCKPKGETVSQAAFSPYISAYTGGMISAGSTIIVELTKEQPEEVRTKEIDGKLFSFSPSVKGKAHWLNANTVEYVPEEGEIQAGAAYKVKFALGKVLDVEKKYAEFNFSFRVEEHTFKVSVEPVEFLPDNTVVVRGELMIDKIVSPDVVKKMVTATLDNRKVEVTVEGWDNAREFKFFVSGITRTDKVRELLFLLDGAAGKIKRKETVPAVIPAKGRFSLYEYEMTGSPEYGLRLVFSDPVSESQDLKSMITLPDISDYSVQVQANRVMVYFTRPSGMDELNVVVHAEMKSLTGDALGDVKEFTLSFEKLKPQVEILSKGIVMPGSEHLILPFRAVALHAVDLKVIRIFENNVMMFLQDNVLEESASYQLRRAGRLVYKKTFRLDTNPAKDISRWENYSINLTKLVKQQPGAIYRIELSFRKEYASYECEDYEVERERVLAGTVGMTDISGEEGALSEEDEKYWDEPTVYYYDGYDLKVDWNLYDWNERDNPCHPTYYMQSQRKAVTNVLASDLGMIAKSNANNTVWVAVTNLLDTRSVQGAKVTAYNFQLQPTGTGVTDENGFTVLSLKKKPFILVASTGEQKAYLRMTDGQENMLSRFDVGGMELKKGLKGYIYGERGVWRPGDTLHIAFMLEDRGKKIPENHPVTFEIYNPHGQFYKKMTSTTGVGGLYTFDVPTGAGDPTGLWNAYVKAGGASFHKSLRIETIKPNRLKINLNLPDVIEASKGTVSVGIHSQWLTGVTARNLDVKTELLLSKVSTQFKGYEQYIFNHPATEFSSSRTEVFSGKLDENGNVAFEMKTPLAENAPGMLRAYITCRVFEPGGDAGIFTQSVPFSPYSSYTGVNFNRREDENYLFTDEDHIFDVVTLSAEGKPLSRNNLEFKIYRIGWSWWWESENESFASYINNTNYTPVYAGKLKTVGGKGQIKFRVDYPEWGRYLVFVKDMESGHATGGAVLVDWPSWRGRSNKNDPSGIKMLSFSLDKESYDVGEEAVATIPATASGGRALIAFENGSEVMRRVWIDLAAGSDTRYAFKVTEDMSPNVYMHISLLQPHAATADMPIRMYGVVPVFVSNRESVLAPVITMADVLKPETVFEIKVKEESGRPMTYTLAVVDEGLLDLTNFKTPDPWNEFYAREALGIRTWDMFDNVMGAYAGKYGSLFAVGGDADLMNASVVKANRFKPVVIYLGPLTLNAGEEKTHTLRLPSYAGSVRVMVVAGQDGAYGKADKTVAVRAPVMSLSSLPRVLSVGEKISLPVNIFAMEENVKNVTVKVETAGKLTTTDGNSRSSTFKAPGDNIVYFPMKTGAETGMETVTVTAAGGGHTSTETIEIEIRNPNPPALTYESKMLEKGRSVEFDYAFDTFSGEGSWAKIEMSRIPAVDISRRFDFLYDYRHYCTEQLTSCALPLLYLSELKEMDGRETEQTKKNITEAILNLYKRQSANGGFAYWAGEGAVNDWVSSYAGNFLVLAVERGYNVNSGVINRWISYQRSVARNWRMNNDFNRRYAYSQADFLQAYRLYTLALAGAPEMAAMNRLKEVKDLSLQSRWRLAAAYAMCGRQDAANELVFNVSSAVEPYSSNNPTYGSYSRDEAMILETLLLMDKQEEAFRQARKISGNLSHETYFSTQSTAYAMVAMGRFASKMSGKFDFEWSLNGKPQKKVNTQKAVYQQTLPASPPAGKVKVENGSEGALYVGLSVKTRPIVDNLPAVSENIRLDVSYADMKGDPVDVSDLMQGTDFYAVIKVSNVSAGNDYSDVALTHMIPSGWEIVNERMVASGAIGNNEDKSVYQDVRDDCVLTYFDLPAGRTKEIKVRLQASYTGEFVFPAILCEAMYDASARARTTAGRVKVYK